MSFLGVTSDQYKKYLNTIEKTSALKQKPIAAVTMKRNGIENNINGKRCSKTSSSSSSSSSNDTKIIKKQSCKPTDNNPPQQ